MFNQCSACKAKDEEIKHLRAIVDSVLIAKGMSPVSSEPTSAAADPLEVKEKIEGDNNIVSYGGDE